MYDAVLDHHGNILKALCLVHAHRIRIVAAVVIVEGITGILIGQRYTGRTIGIVLAVAVLLESVAAFCLTVLVAANDLIILFDNRRTLFTPNPRM